jgi:hypothetical protein
MPVQANLCLCNNPLNQSNPVLAIDCRAGHVPCGQGQCEPVSTAPLQYGKPIRSMPNRSHHCRSKPVIADPMQCDKPIRSALCPAIPSPGCPRQSNTETFCLVNQSNPMNAHPILCRAIVRRADQSRSDKPIHSGPGPYTPLYAMPSRSLQCRSYAINQSYPVSAFPRPSGQVRTSQNLSHAI